MRLATLKQLKKPRGKRVLLRLDLNVPLEYKGEGKGRVAMGGDARIRAVLPTLAHLRKLGARVVIVSHLGRPVGRDRKCSLAPIAKRLSALAGVEIGFVADALDDGDKADRKLGKVLDGEAVMLENIRFHKGEKANSVFLARRLASFADVFVNDAFSVCHRAQASVVGVAKLLPSYAGLQLEREVTCLSKVTEKPKRPFVVMMGGAKVSDKIHAIEHLAKLADKVLIGGAMVQAFVKAKGLRIGKSQVSPADVRLAKSLLRKRNVIIPTDVVVATALDERADAQVRPIEGIGKDEYVVDVGTETVRRWAGILKDAKTLVWNGPLGMFEIKKFSHGSVALGRVLAARSSGKAFGVVGGGETVECLERTGMAEFVDHVSTGGGAMLDFLADRKLPGLVPLIKK